MIHGLIPVSCHCWVSHTPHSWLSHLLVAVFGGTHHSYWSAWGQDPTYSSGWHRDSTGSRVWHHRSGKVVPTPLSRFPLLLPQKWHLCPCSTHTDTEMSWGWSSPNLCLELLNGPAIIAWRLLVFTIVFIIYPLSTLFVLLTLPPSLISFYTEKAIDQIPLHVLAFHWPLQKSIQWIPENEKKP